MQESYTLHPSLFLDPPHKAGARNPVASGFLSHAYTNIILLALL